MAVVRLNSDIGEKDKSVGKLIMSKKDAKKFAQQNQNAKIVKR